MAEAVPTVTDLAGRSFTSASVQGKELVEGSVLRLSFDEDRMAAHAGCNSMGGPYRIEDGHLAWAGAVVSTMMACSEELMDQDRWIAELLEAGVEVRSEGSGLVLSTDDLIIVLDGEPDTSGGERHDAPGSVETGATTSPSLEDLVNADGWVVERIGDGIEPPAGFPAPTIELDADGSARVFTGCNQGRGSFEFGDGSILFGPLRLTRMACPPPLTEIESTLLVVLDGPLDVEWDGDALVLVRGDLRVRLRRH